MLKGDFFAQPSATQSGLVRHANCLLRILLVEANARYHVVVVFDDGRMLAFFGALEQVLRLRYLDELLARRAQQCLGHLIKVA